MSQKKAPAESEENNSAAVSLFENATGEIRALRNFAEHINLIPDKSIIQKNKIASTEKKDVLFIPVGEVERLLDETFLGLWKTKKWQVSHIANEVHGSLLLCVFHPVAKIWITRIGTAAVPITFRADTDITDIRNKIKNALVNVIPHLKSECLKNAAHSLGRSFGRDLNREISDYEFEDITEKISVLSELQKKAIALLKTAKLNEKTREIFTKKLRVADDERIQGYIEYLKEKQ